MTSPKGAREKSSKRDAFPMAPFFAESRGGFIRGFGPLLLASASQSFGEVRKTKTDFLK